MSLDIEIRGLDELVRDLGVLGVLRVLRAPMIRSMAAVVNRMADYPPQRPSLYRRTGTLGRRWTQTQPAVNETRRNWWSRSGTIPVTDRGCRASSSRRRFTRDTGRPTWRCWRTCGHRLKRR